MNAVSLVLLVQGLLALLLTRGGCQDVQCYSSMQCTGAGPLRPSIEICCREVTRLSYAIVDDETCSLCNLYGWLNGSNIQLTESGSSYLLQAGYEKTGLQPPTLAFDIMVDPSSTASPSDYSLSADTIQFTGSTAGSVELTLISDGVAGEPVETLVLELVPQTPVPNDVFSNVVVLTVEIVDADTVTTTASTSTQTAGQTTTTGRPDNTTAESDTPTTTTQAPDNTGETNEEAGGGGLSGGQIGGLVAGLIVAVIVAIVAVAIISYGAHYRRTHLNTV